MATLRALRRSGWLAPALLILLSVVPAIAGTARLTSLARGAEMTAENARFVESPVPIVLHLAGVIPFSILGALQFAPSLRRRSNRWHRLAGRALVVCGLVAAVTGLWMAQFYPWPPFDGRGVYIARLLVGTAMLTAIVLGLAAIKRRDFAAHGRWMTRSYALGMGAGTQVITHLPWLIAGTFPSGTSRFAAMASAWVINAVVAEWFLARDSRSPLVSRLDDGRLSRRRAGRVAGAEVDRRADCEASR